MSATGSLRIGVLGAANIARAFTAACASSQNVKVAAVASRGLDKAKAFASEVGIARALGTYEELLADREIDAVYIPLPNSMHAEWAGLPGFLRPSALRFSSASALGFCLFFCSRLGLRLELGLRSPDRLRALRAPRHYLQSCIA
jgi:hypothetical protein